MSVSMSQRYDRALLKAKFLIDEYRLSHSWLAAHLGFARATLTKFLNRTPGYIPEDDAHKTANEILSAIETLRLPGPFIRAIRDDSQVPSIFLAPEQVQYQEHLHALRYYRDQLSPEKLPAVEVLRSSWTLANVALNGPSEYRARMCSNSLLTTMCCVARLAPGDLTRAELGALVTEVEEMERVGSESFPSERIAAKLLGYSGNSLFYLGMLTESSGCVSSGVTKMYQAAADSVFTEDGFVANILLAIDRLIDAQSILFDPWLQKVNALFENGAFDEAIKVSFDIHDFRNLSLRPPRVVVGHPSSPEDSMELSAEFSPALSTVVEVPNKVEARGRFLGGDLTEPLSAMGSRIVEARLRTGYTREEIRDKTGLSPGRQWELESGRRPWTLNTLASYGRVVLDRYELQELLMDQLLDGVGDSGQSDFNTFSDAICAARQAGNDSNWRQFHEAIMDAERLALTSSERAEAAILSANQYKDRGHYDLAERYMRQAETLLGNQEGPLQARLLANLGGLYFEKSLLRQARMYAESALLVTGVSKTTELFAKATLARCDLANDPNNRVAILQVEKVAQSYGDIDLDNYGDWLRLEKARLCAATGDKSVAEFQNLLAKYGPRDEPGDSEIYVSAMCELYRCTHEEKFRAEALLVARRLNNVQHIARIHKYDIGRAFQIAQSRCQGAHARGTLKSLQEIVRNQTDLESQLLLGPSGSIDASVMHRVLKNSGLELSRSTVRRVVYVLQEALQSVLATTGYSREEIAPDEKPGSSFKAQLS